MNKTEHLLVCLAEEAAELQQAVSKALRFGLSDGYPESATTNRHDIEREFIDLLAVMELLDDLDIVRPYVTSDKLSEKKTKVCKWLEYAREHETLNEL